MSFTLPLFTVNDRDFAVDWLENYGELSDGNYCHGFISYRVILIFYHSINQFYSVQEFRERIGRAALSHGSPLFQFRLFRVIRLCRLRPTPARTTEMLDLLRGINIVSPDVRDRRFLTLIYLLRCKCNHDQILYLFSSIHILLFLFSFFFRALRL